MEGKGGISPCNLYSFLVDAKVFLHLEKDIYSESKKLKKKKVKCCNLSVVGFDFSESQISCPMQMCYL